MKEYLSPVKQPPASMNQIIRYLADKYAHSKRMWRFFGKVDPEDHSELAEHYRRVSLQYHDEAMIFRSTIRHIYSGDAATWIVGMKVNTP